MTRPTNAVLLEKITNIIDNNKEDHQAIVDHLKQLNSSVARNTTFRQRLTGGFVVISSLGMIVGVVKLII